MALLLQRNDGVIVTQRWWSWVHNDGGACCGASGAHYNIVVTRYYSLQCSDVVALL
jgi:hypothetical protein